MGDVFGVAEPRVVYRDADLLVFDKPSGLPTTSPDGKNCLAAFARQLDPLAARMHPSSRLDAEVTGVVTFARTDRAIAALLAARAKGAYERTYVGLACHALEPASGQWCWPIAQDPREVRKRIALPEDSTEGSPALSLYQVHARLEQATCVLLFPQTGRTHQLRVHAARAGAALFGDRHYGGPSHAVLVDGRVVRARRVMLHCVRVVLPALDGDAQLCLEAPVPSDMLSFFSELGGDPRLLTASAIGRTR